MPAKCCPHCGERTGFEVRFNVICRIDGQEEKGYLRICKVCGGRFITVRRDEASEESEGSSEMQRTSS